MCELLSLFFPSRSQFSRASIYTIACTYSRFVIPLIVGMSLFFFLFPTTREPLDPGNSERISRLEEQLPRSRKTRSIHSEYLVRSKRRKLCKSRIFGSHFSVYEFKKYWKKKKVQRLERVSFFLSVFVTWLRDKSLRKICLTFRPFSRVYRGSLDYVKVAV